MRHAFPTPTRHGARVFQAPSTAARLLRPNKHQNRPRCASSAKAPAANTVQHLEPGTAGCSRNTQSWRAAACGLLRRNIPTLPLPASKRPSCTVVGPASTGHSAALTACAAATAPTLCPEGHRDHYNSAWGARTAFASPAAARSPPAFPPLFSPSAGARRPQAPRADALFGAKARIQTPHLCVQVPPTSARPDVRASLGRSCND